MITRIYLENFRAISEGAIDLGKINIFTGANNSGKSSIIYGLLALKNIVLNPNQNLDSFLNLGYINLGGFSQSVFLKNESNNIKLGLMTSDDDIISVYQVVLGKKKSEFSLNAISPAHFSLNLDITFPYPMNSSTGANIPTISGQAKITWNGISPTINILPATNVGTPASNDALVKSVDEFLKAGKPDAQLPTQEQILGCINNPIEELRGVDFIPVRRGFTKPVYSSVPMQPQLLNEDEYATLLATDRDLEGKVAHYLGKIVDRFFTVRPTLGTATFNLQARDTKTGFVSDLVNEGFGTNQLVTMLTKILRKDTKTVCIEEAEIHLNPQALDRLIDVIIEISHEEDKNFIISSHSEHIALGFLNRILENKNNKEDLMFYYVYKDGKKTKTEYQELNDKGQIEGGLKGFFEQEIKGVKKFLDISGE